MTDFLDDERRRLAYADRSPTLEQRDRKLLPDGHLGECVLTIDDGWRCAVGCRDAQLAAAERSAERQLADGTGRHSRKEIEAGLEWLAANLTSCDFVGDSGCTDPTCQKCHGPTPPTQTIAGVQFSSVPALCAFVEQLLSANAAYLWTWRPDREHCSGPQMEAYRELRRLVAGAGKDVP